MEAYNGEMHLKQGAGFARSRWISCSHSFQHFVFLKED